MLNNSYVIISENQSYLVPGTIPHAIWNNQPDTTIMIGISVK